MNDITVLIGQTIIGISKTHDEIIFKLSNGDAYRMHHHQDCCESVTIEDIDGDINDLIGSPILEAEERTDSKTPKTQEYASESFTWTFYTIRNIKASLTIRWYGESNGYYSEGVDFEKMQ